MDSYGQDLGWNKLKLCLKTNGLYLFTQNEKTARSLDQNVRSS